ncbi:hypothetical protein L596_012258 [Steinernema carpocapsae]|uniref:Rhodanese domain-containing protein n=1 Tax=Steinernema carpocapsae TaxID=34508 RepID=A0A4U5NWW0_STECR|nr:hypothetical protein L596_012258 [Steinernema carpocapsae]
MRFERWRTAAPPQARPYNTVQDSRFHQTEYEDPDYYYSCPPESVQTKTMDFPSGSTGKFHPPLPPLPFQATFDRALVGGSKSSAASSSLAPQKDNHRTNTKAYLIGACFTAISLLLTATIVAFLALRPPQNLFGGSSFTQRSTSRPSPLIHGTSDSVFTQSPASSEAPQSQKSVDRVIEANNLLTLLITKRKLCIFEASSDRVEFSRQQFREEHIEGARLLFFTNLSHSGVPVHPLQFQRYVRNLGVDGDCHVVIYDRDSRFGPLMLIGFSRYSGTRKFPF